MLLLDGISSWLKFKLIVYSQTSDCYAEYYGKKQSPIGVCKRSSRNIIPPPLKFYYYKKPFKADVVNNGIDVRITIIDADNRCDLPTVTGGPLDGTFIFDNVHFHWPSEHTIDGKRYPLEAHILHFNKKCGSMESAKGYPDGILGVSVMFQIEKCYNPRLDNIIIATEKIAKSVNKPLQIKGGIVVDHLLPANRRKFYMYEGSSTLPKYSENVKWIVFEQVVPIGQDQLDKLTNIYTKEGEPLTRNCRPLQEINDRKVLYASDTVTAKYIKDFVKDKLGVD